MSEFKRNCAEAEAVYEALNSAGQKTDKNFVDAAHKRIRRRVAVNMSLKEHQYVSFIFN